MKYELTKETKTLCETILYRIKALKDFSNVKKGDLGGWIEKEENLSQEENAWVYGDAKVYGDAEINEENRIITGYINKDYKDIKSKLAIQLGVYPLNNKIILFKRVNKKSKGIYTSCYDSKFEYKDNQIVKVKDYNKFNTSCGEGIHLSTPLYWNEGDTLIACEVNLKDIITIQRGKVRCKKCKVIGEVKLK